MNAGRLFLASAAALFVELVLIRWIGSEVRIFAYFQNLVLIACLLGFGLGFLRSTPARLLRSVVVLELLLGLVGLAQREQLAWGPASISSAFSQAEDAITMGGGGALGDSWAMSAVAWLWVVGLVGGVVVTLHGYAQRIAVELEASPPEARLRAYGWNLLGSLAGVLAFAGFGAAALPPTAWVAAAIAATLPLLAGRKARLQVALGGLAAVAAVWPAPGVTWSAYQKLEVVPQTGAVLVNGTGYMVLRSFDRAPGELERAGVDRWRLPHTARPGARSVLIVGAGGGNDVSAALRAGAQRVVAVEIDREILRFGREHHPDRPYQDPRVEVVIDDARHYAEVTTERFDLVIFSHLDAHGTLSAFTNVRLDNYVHTVESFETFTRLLSPGGALYVSFQAIRPWIADRLARNLTLALDGAPPIEWRGRTAGTDVLVHLLATRDESVRRRADALGREVYGRGEAATVEPSTDAWPYLYVERRAIPRPMLIIALTLLALSAVVVWRARPRADVALPRAELRHFFFLGAAFLLVEVHAVSRLALVFGTTWSVNAWVISGVLVVCMGATALAGRVGPSPRWAYAPLLLLLAAGALVPLRALLGLPLGPAAAVALFTTPLLFAGLLFGASFRRTPSPGQALGANVLGSLAGGFLELASFHVGLPGLLWIAALLYALSWPRPPLAPVPST